MPHTPLREGSLLQFVAEHLGVKTSDLIRLGAEQGYKLTPQAVHQARYTLKQRGITEPLPAPPKRPTRAPAPARSLKRAPGDDRDAELLRLFYAVGYDRARKRLEDFRKRLEEATA